MSEYWELKEYFYNYEEPINPNFQRIISAKEEFAELESSVDEKLPEDEPISYFKHQKFYHRYLRSYDDLIILDETGTGKTCSVIGFIERVLSEKLKKKQGQEEFDEILTKFKKIYILTRGKNQMEDLRKQVICKCSGEKYKSKLLKEAKTEKAQRKVIKTQLRDEGYEITTYQKFVSYFLRTYPIEDEKRKEKIEKEYSDCIFWIDEAHNLILDNYAVSRSEAKEKFGLGPGLDKKTVYDEIWFLFHTIKRCKKILSTATPMINDVNDFRFLINLLLPENNYVPREWDLSLIDKDFYFRKAFFPNFPLNEPLFNKSYDILDSYFRGQIPEELDLNLVELDDIEPYLRSKIGYIRAGKADIIIKEMGKRIESYLNPETGKRERSFLTLYISYMSKFQEEAYMKSKERESKSKEFFTSSRQASNFVFPDGKWGSGKRVQDTSVAETFGQVKTLEREKVQSSAYNRYVFKDQNRTVYATSELKKYLSNLDKLKELSSKFYEIITLSKTAYGNCFIYSDFVEGSGSEVLSLAFQEQGFEPFREKISVFVQKENILELRSYCTSGKEDLTKRSLRKNFIPYSKGGPLRYALLTKDTSEIEFQVIMEAINSYENRHGDLIKVLISSRVGRDGLNINNVTQIHLVGPEWNQSAIYQAISRGIRTLSHEDLIKELKDLDREKKLTVEIYKHCAVVEGKDLSLSTDFHMYTVSEKKDIKIRKFMRYLKQCSIGCFIQYKRNVHEDDKDFTPECDYDICKYKCFNFKEHNKIEDEERNYENYNSLYAKEYIDKLKNDIASIMRNNIVLDFKKIESLLSEISTRKYFLADKLRALYEIISKKIPIIDKFGYTNYLVEDNGFYALVREPEKKDPLFLSYYTRRINNIMSYSLRQILDERNKNIKKKYLEILREKIINKEEYKDFLNKLSPTIQTFILEEAILEKVKDNNDLIFEAIREHYKNVLFVLAEQTMKKKTNVQDVYIHLLLAQTINKSKYGIIAKYTKAKGNIRILKISELEKGWYTMNKEELALYSSFITKQIETRKEEFEKYDIYGIILKDGKFRIRDKTTEKEKSFSDERFINRGRICSSWDKKSLVDLCWKLKIEETSKKHPSYQEKDRNSLVETLNKKKLGKTKEELMNMDLEQLIFYYKWYTAKIKREEICEIIKKYLMEKNMIFE